MGYIFTRNWRGEDVFLREADKKKASDKKKRKRISNMRKQSKKRNRK